MCSISFLLHGGIFYYRVNESRMAQWLTLVLLQLLHDCLQPREKMFSNNIRCFALVTLRRWSFVFVYCQSHRWGRLMTLVIPRPLEWFAVEPLRLSPPLEPVLSYNVRKVADFSRCSMLCFNLHEILVKIAARRARYCAMYQNILPRFFFRSTLSSRPGLLWSLLYPSDLWVFPPPDGFPPELGKYGFSSARFLEDNEKVQYV